MSRVPGREVIGTDPDVQVVSLVVCVDSAEDHERYEGPVWNLKERGVEGVEAKAFDNDSAAVRVQLSAADRDHRRDPLTSWK